ncbi:hypothetical protein [Spirosoma horti]
MLSQNRRLVGIVLTVALLLSVPLIAMQFTHEVNWSPVDFIVAGVLLLGTGLACEFVLRSVTRMNYRLAICGALLLLLLLIWIELAVGIFGSPLAGS